MYTDAMADQPADIDEVEEYFLERPAAYVDEIATSSQTVTILTGRTNYHPTGTIHKKFGWIVESVHEQESSVFITFVAPSEDSNAE
jgi:hypothetical protein